MALILCVVLPTLLFAGLTVHSRAASASATAAQRLKGISHTYAVAVASRLSAAQTLVQALSAQDAGDGSALAQHAINARAFKSVALIERDGPLAGDAAALRPSAAQRAALEAGETVLVPVTLQGQLPAIFLARAVLAGGSPRLAYFELAPEWLWKDLRTGHTDVVIAIVDSQQRVLASPIALAPELVGMFAHRIDREGERSEQTESLGWQAGGHGWLGSLSHVALANERITAAPWAVIAIRPEAGVLASTPGLWSDRSLALLRGLLVAAAAAGYLVASYAPALEAVRGGLADLQAQRYAPLRPRGSDEPRALIEALNQHASGVQVQLRSLQTLAEIDRLLLGSAGLEQVLDAILSRVQAVTRCHTVGIALRDGDAPGHGRVYLAAAGLNDLPVSRVALDEDMLATLAAETAGLTIMRCEDTRHSFLKPLKETGSELFWVWPVMVTERIEAILAVGYRDLPAIDPQVTRSGSEFASRLAVALSKSARDERLYRQAHYDPLTALPNRLLFRDRLSHELASCAAGSSRGALLYIDLDHFKRVNDSVGHSAGDQLLTIIAQRLRACVKDGDTVARLGGDEFAVVLRNIADSAAPAAVAERIVESLQLPVSIGGRDHHIGASIGITLFPEDGASIEELVRNADTAMYRAKDLGRGRTMFFEHSMAVATLVPTDSGLHRALRRREFSLFYQPQFAITDGSLTGVEALLRWQTPRDGVRQPAEFVPAAEESGLIVDIGGWVLESACQQLAAWRDTGVAPPRLSINVALPQLKDPEFPKAVRRALEKYGLPGSLLELELTENVFAEEAAAAALGRLAQTGVQLVLDGFGTGYSSLNYLRQYPIDAVKLDRAFLVDVPHNPASSTLIETVIVMVHALGKRVVAEGIETIEQLDFLRERRCDVAQGFYLARPLTAGGMTELLHARMVSTRDLDVRATG